ncbi:MAG TPA: hypothetical protein DIC53_05860 [Synergistaceae bacterium]|nr:hypothetical protein [Synergistaceae bacterium]
MNFFRELPGASGRRADFYEEQRIPGRQWADRMRRRGRETSKGRRDRKPVNNSTKEEMMCTWIQGT